MAPNPPWTKADDKRFELALLQFNGDLETIAQYLQKPLAEVKYYHDAMLRDIELIESDMYDLPKFPEDDDVSETEADQLKNPITNIKRGTEEEDDDVSDTEAGQLKNPMTKRKRGMEEEDDDVSDTEAGQLKNPITKIKRGTEEEDGLFLDGLKKRGRGDGNSKMISQVASHAQAYFDKIEKSEEKEKRSNTTSVDETENVTNDLGEQKPSDDVKEGSCPGV
ncbi:hypothetical protein V5N11_015810 [Cardamine amara subsp. amara]|uniref:SANT domain-containing protein n=1 Tax=Cardamine amara subsp. amara TaxID=228776 RepID=A0ABD0YZG5_CARAN